MSYKIKFAVLLKSVWKSTVEWREVNVYVVCFDGGHMDVCQEQ